MIANELTKALSRPEFNEFLQQVSLTDIADRITEREAEDSQKKLDHNNLGVYLGDTD